MHIIFLVASLFTFSTSLTHRLTIHASTSNFKNQVSSHSGDFKINVKDYKLKSKRVQFNNPFKQTHQTDLNFQHYQDYIVNLYQNDGNNLITIPDLSDSETRLALARMAKDAYLEIPNEESWHDIGGNFNLSNSFGWSSDGIRGYIFYDSVSDIVVISFKGTSLGGDTSSNDKFNDNVMFSCCCGKVDIIWKGICKCGNSQFSLFNRPNLNQCDWSCLKSASTFEDSYYTLASKIVDIVDGMFPTLA